MIKKSLARFLEDSDGIRDYVDGRIFALRAPQGAPRPYVILGRSGGVVYNDLPGEAPCTKVSVDITIYADDNTTSSNLSQLIRNRLSGYRGPMGEFCCYGAASVSPAFESRIALSSAVGLRGTGGDDWVFTSSTVYDIVHDQPIPNHT